LLGVYFFFPLLFFSFPFFSFPFPPFLFPLLSLLFLFPFPFLYLISFLHLPFSLFLWTSFSKICCFLPFRRGLRFKVTTIGLETNSLSLAFRHSNKTFRKFQKQKRLNFEALRKKQLLFTVTVYFTVTPSFNFFVASTMLRACSNQKSSCWGNERYF